MAVAKNTISRTPSQSKAGITITAEQYEAIIALTMVLNDVAQADYDFFPKALLEMVAHQGCDLMEELDELRPAGPGRGDE